MSKKSVTRIYIVTDAKGVKHLVEASSQSTAVAHVYSAAGLVTAASAKTAAELLAASAKTESASAPDEEQAVLPLADPSTT